MNIKVFYEDENIIVVLKEPGIPSQPDKTGDKDIMTMLIEDKKLKNIGIINRLDRPVGGIMIFSKNKKYNTILSDFIRQNKIVKTYLAVVYGRTPQRANLENFLLKNSRLNISNVVNYNTSGAKKAILNYQTVDVKDDCELGEISLLKVNLITGRHHQIRVQLSNSGFPIVGDMKYSNIKNVKKVNISLFSAGLSFKLYDNIDKFDFFEIPNYYPFNIFKYKNIN